MDELLAAKLVDEEALAPCAVRIEPADSADSAAAAGGSDPSRVPAGGETGSVGGGADSTFVARATHRASGAAVTVNHERRVEVVA